MITRLLTLALANPTVAAVMFGVAFLAISGAVGGMYYHVYNKGVMHERGIWDEKVEKAAAAREQERAKAQREQTKLAGELITTELEMAVEERNHENELARALAVNSADMAACRVLPNSLLQPLRAVGAGRAPAARGN